MKAMKKLELHVKVRQVDGSKFEHMLWPMKYCQVGANLFQLTCKLLQGTILSSENKHKTLLDTVNGKIVLYQRIKTGDGCMAEVDLHCKKIGKKACVSREDFEVMIKFQKSQDIYELHIELVHPSEEIM